MNKPKSICVFCGSKIGTHPVYEKSAIDLGHILAKNRIRLVYGGGGVGLMGTIAKTTHSSKGQVTGIIPRALAKMELQYEAADEKVITENMHDRRHEMYVRSDAFVVLPGGVGTLEETIEVLSWATLGFQNKPLVVYNVEGYWDPLIALLQHTIDKGFTNPDVLDGPQDNESLLITDDVNEILPLIETAMNSRSAATMGADFKP